MVRLDKMSRRDWGREWRLQPRHVNPRIQDKWHTLFQHKYEETVVWTFSEIAIDTLFSETELECYCVSEYPAHKHFYGVTYKGQNMMGYFRRLYRDNSISEFMRLGIEIVRELENIL